MGRRNGLLLLPLVFVLGCQRDADGNLREAYEQMMASAERRAAERVERSAPPAADTAQVAADTPRVAAALPIDTLPAPAAPAEPEVVEAPAAPDTAPRAFEGTGGPQRRPAPGISPATLRDVRAASHTGFDRVVFEFEGAVPGYSVEFVSPPVRECGSGRAVQVAGQGRLQVRLEPSRAHAFDGERARTTVANRNRSLNHPVLQQLTQTCDFEGRVEWVLGLAEPNRYRLLELSEPARLVIDVLH